MTNTRREFIKNTGLLAGASLFGNVCASVNPLPSWIAQKANKPAQAPIDRHALVSRHNVVIEKVDARNPLQVGNGEFAFGTDITGLQTFYGNTMSQWGWHTAPLPAGKKIEDFQLEQWDSYGRKVGYATRPYLSSKGQDPLYEWLRANPHRLNLGRFRLLIDENIPIPADIVRPRQELDLWRGRVISRYEIAGQSVEVQTCVHPTRDLVAFRVSSSLLKEGRMAFELGFPYGSEKFGGNGEDWTLPARHETQWVLPNEYQADIKRRLDDDHYSVRLAWEGTASLTERRAHELILHPKTNAGVFEFSCSFAKEAFGGEPAKPQAIFEESAKHWQTFWTTGGAVDLSGSKDQRWRELERRIVLSQYLVAVNEAGSLPLAESALANNSWYGKFNLEMHWWHGAHFALWDRWPLFERSLGWYHQILATARETAKQQGYRGARWPKTPGPEGRDMPSPVSPLLIWQQPHPICYAQLDYRLRPTRETLEKWRDIVFATAEFMASFAVLDPQTGKFNLGPPIKTMPENTDAKTTRNPAFELSYWRFGLRVAQGWREKLGLAREPAWDNVLNNLAPLPQMDGVYLLQEGMTDTYSSKNFEHPSLIGMLGMLPGDGVDKKVMKATVRKVWETWRWGRVWGWDFQMMAMAAARNGEPDIAVAALLHSAKTNEVSANGFPSGGPYPYFPPSGGLLYTIALMAAGWDGGPEGNAPGFPADGSWVVKWEGLKTAP